MPLDLICRTPSAFANLQRPRWSKKCRPANLRKSLSTNFEILTRCRSCSSEFKQGDAKAGASLSTASSAAAPAKAPAKPAVKGSAAGSAASAPAASASTEADSKSSTASAAASASRAVEPAYTLLCASAADAAESDFVPLAAFVRAASSGTRPARLVLAIQLPDLVSRLGSRFFLSFIL